jgi:hypothetical protein
MLQGMGPAGGAAGAGREALPAKLLHCVGVAHCARCPYCFDN